MQGKDVLLEVKDLHVHFPVRRGILFKKTVAEVKAVDGISFNVHAGETVGLVGESGCGKTTTGRAILKLIEPTSGSIVYKGQDISGFSQKEMLPLRHEMQMVFQDPYASLNPRMCVMDIVTDPLIEHKVITHSQKEDTARKLLEIVGLERFMVCDEPIAALDVSIQAQVINLFQDLQEKMGLAYLFIAHDLSVVRHISDRIAVMYIGKIVETAEKHDLFKNPMHPYTKVLLSSVPTPDPANERRRRRIELVGEIPSPLNKPKGCPFCTRCPNAMDVCKIEEPSMIDVGDGHQVACHLIKR